MPFAPRTPKTKFSKAQCLGEGQTSKIEIHRSMILFNYQQLEAGQRRDKERQVARITSRRRKAVARVVNKNTYPNEVADSSLYSGHGGCEVRDGFPVHLTFFVHYHQMGYLLSHRLQNTFYGFCMKNRHDGNFRPLTIRKTGINYPFRFTPLSYVKNAESVS